MVCDCDRLERVQQGQQCVPDPFHLGIGVADIDTQLCSGRGHGERLEVCETVVPPASQEHR